jgi:hypothetical protein
MLEETDEELVREVNPSELDEEINDDCVAGYVEELENAAPVELVLND